MAKVIQTLMVWTLVRHSINWFIPTTVRLVFSLVTSSYEWHIHWSDINNTFLNGLLTLTVYMEQPIQEKRYGDSGWSVA